jgi:putative SOS response-associated peptidase YedK
MCGRYTITDREAARIVLAETFGIADATRGPRYNVAPRQLNPVVSAGADSAPALSSMSWGLVPFWDRSEKPKIAPINARSEDVLTKPMFRRAVQKRRCAVLADGFYEWATLAGGAKQPYYLTITDRAPFFLAGIFEDAASERPASYALLTTRPNAVLDPFHDRMPIILTGQEARDWVKPGEMTAEMLSGFREPFPAEWMQAWPVSTLVNRPAVDLPGCVAPVSS